mgnify:CR=1 FL=1
MKKHKSGMHVSTAHNWLTHATRLMQDLTWGAKSAGYSHDRILQERDRIFKQCKYDKWPGWARIHFSERFDAALGMRALSVITLHESELKALLEGAAYARPPQYIRSQAYLFGQPVDKPEYDTEEKRNNLMFRFEWAHNRKPFTNMTWGLRPSGDPRPTDEELAALGLSNPTDVLYSPAVHLLEHLANPR